MTESPDDSPESTPAVSSPKEKFWVMLGGGVWGRLKTYFIAGILVTAPIFITIQVAWLLIQFVDSSIIPLIPPHYNPELLLRKYLDIPIVLPGFGLLILIVFITLVGALAAGILGRLFIAWGERVLDTLPFVRTLYSGSKQILKTVLHNQTEAFRTAVLLEYPRPGIWAVGFITSTTDGEIKDKLPDDMVNIFLPTTPNPTSGFLLFVPRKDVIILDMAIEDAVKLIISAGIVQRPGSEDGHAG